MHMYKWLIASCWVRAGMVGLTLFLIAYPNPVRFWRTVARALNPPIEPAAVAHISATLADDPARIEDWIKEHVTYDANDYEGWGVVSYVASPTEVLQRGRGPCYGQAVVLASILAHKGIPYRIYATVGHVWVDYDGRQSRQLIENRQLAQFRWDEGQWNFQGLGSLTMTAWATAGITKLYWDDMPLLGKTLLLTLVVAVVALRWHPWRRFNPRSQ